MPGSYDKLTVDVITATRTVRSPSNAGQTNRLPQASSTSAPKRPSSLRSKLRRSTGPGHEIDQAHEITVDDNNQLTYSAAINIHVPGGIAGLEVDVSSPVLSMLGISKLDLFNDSDVIEGISFADLGLSCQTENTI